ncbi:nucleoside-diphosphate sugar epimerase/dehydratase [Proteinivorax tanatarense]|uniref:Nucleoside-diphosphate sugar epimerase/dehydratase n=1 Tax=Proteinivorax tanatarense TaxID=1260629 RepID=A0AAU7VII8_9FIRM
MLIEKTLALLNNLTAKFRKTVLFFSDTILINIALSISIFTTYKANPLVIYDRYLLFAFITTVCMLLSFSYYRLYSSLWRYASIEELMLIVKGVTIGTMIIFIGHTIIGPGDHVRMFFAFYSYNLLSVGGSRLAYRVLRRAKMGVMNSKNCRSRVMIIGGGQAGQIIIKEMFQAPDTYKYPVAVIDDDYCKHHRRMHGVPIVGGRENIIKAAKEYKVDEIIIAMPSVSRRETRQILNICKQTNCKVKTLPGMYELIDGKIDIKQIRDVQIEDLLGREPVEVNLGDITQYIENKTVLITGGGGSIGSELCRQVLKYNPTKLVIVDNYENNAYEIQQELIRKYGQAIDLEAIIASVREVSRMDEIFETYKPSVVFHAAAHKHVPLMEKSPLEAVKNNVFGTLNTAQMADKHNVKRFVLISTDKAVNPTNIMGATKRLAEKIIQSMDKQSETDFVAVRFGNVLGSNGSVIPLFKNQIAQGGPLTVTHPEITRFFMTIPEAVQLVIQAGSMAEGGEIFVLDMGEPVKITDLAQDLIKLSGLEPDKDIEIQFTGLRPGEKLYEELLMAEEGLKGTHHEKIFVGKPLVDNPKEVLESLKYLEKLVEKGEDLSTIEAMKKLVPTYRQTG